MSLQTPSKIRMLKRKLYRKANDEPDHAPTRGTRTLASEVIFGSLGVLHLRRVHLGARP